MGENPLIIYMRV